MYPSLSNDKFADGDNSPKRETIETSIDCLTNRLDELSFTISQLSEKAKPFLRDKVTGDKDDCNNVNTKNESILKTVIDRQIDKVNDLTEVVHDLIYRLDI